MKNYENKFDKTRRIKSKDLYTRLLKYNIFPIRSKIISQSYK